VVSEGEDDFGMDELTPERAAGISVCAAATFRASSWRSPVVATILNASGFL